jgi:tetratricopeptide (TPR) repeat protein
VFHDLGHLDDVIQHLLDQNLVQTPSPPTSPTSSASSTSSFDSFVLEPDARDHVRSSLTPDEQLDHAWLACHVCVDGIKQKELDSQTLPEIHDFDRIMGPHAKTCYDDWSGVLEQWPDEDDVAWQVLGKVCMAQGSVEQAIGCFELALKQGALMQPIERIQTSLSLASLLNQAGRFESSTEVLNSIDIASIDKALGFRIAMAKASAAAAQGELDHAENQYETLEHEQEETLGPTDITTVGTVQRLASTLEQLGRLEESRALYRRVYISYQNLFGQAHPMTLEALDDLAHVSRLGNAIDEAESLYTQSVDIKRRTLGEDHPSTAHALQKLAVIDDLRCRYDAAHTKYQTALDIMSRTVGRAHPLYTTTMENMALSSRWHGRSLYDDDLSPGHVDGAPPLASRPRAVMQETRRRRAFEHAEKLYLDVLRIKRDARELYSEEQVLETGTKLREMYENEEFFEGRRRRKVERLLEMLREGRRRGSC